MPTASNPFLEGNFAPVHDELSTTKLPITGAIPDFLDGRYLRNGPNPIAEVDPATYHWFAGDGMVHGIRIADGAAHWYRRRWVRSPEVSRRLGETPVPGVRGLGANTNVIGHAGRTYALVEGGVANYELTEELDTVGPCGFDGSIPGGYTAHPKRDPDTGDLHAVSYFFGGGNTVRYSVIGADGTTRRSVDLEVAGSPMMHDFSLTQDHIVLYDLPVTFDARQAVAESVPAPLRLPARLVLSALIGRVRVPDPIAARALSGGANGRLPYSWNPRYPARVGVLPRGGDNADVRWFDIEPCYVFHPLNAYDADDGTIVLDVIRHPKMFDTELRGPAEGIPTLDRWTVDLSAGKVRQERLDDRPQEFPRINEQLVGKQHRYGYSAGLSIGRDADNDTVFKHDLHRGASATRSFGKGSEVGEFVFRPRPGATAEDDGVLMGLVYDAADDRSDLVLLDGGSLETVAAVHLPARVPAGFHGNWIPTDESAS